MQLISKNLKLSDSGFYDDQLPDEISICFLDTNTYAEAKQVAVDYVN